MDPTIKKILKANYVDGVFHNYVSLIKPRGKFHFNRETLESFWEIYCNLLKNTENPVVGLAEKPQQYLPVIVDIDLKIRDPGEDIKEYSEHLYTDEQLEAVVQTYQSVLRQIVDECTEEDLTCVVLEKDIYTETKGDNMYIKNGFHLHFPNIFLNKIDQETQLIPRVQDILKEGKTFYSLGYEDSSAVVDKVCCKVPWLLYGSRKSEDHHPYVVTRIYNSEMANVSLEKAFKNYQLFDHREQLIPIKGNVELFLPRILSIVPYGRNTKQMRRGIISPLKQKLKKDRKASSTHRKMSPEEALVLARRLLPMLSDFRADDRNDWMTVGWVLYNETEGHPDALDLWCEFSSRCEDKYDENTCIHLWERMTKGDLSFGTLRHYAKIDNPGEYSRFKEECAAKHIASSLDGSHNDVAKTLYAEYGDEFVCASFSGKVWFQFIGHRWEEIEEGVFLREKISGKIVEKYVEAGKRLLEEMPGQQDKGKEAMIHTRLKQAQKMISNLKNSSYKNAVMRECCEVFYDPKFKERLDMNPYLIAFKNGVYDLQQNIFRPGRPEDYLSKTMPINYIEFSEDDEKVLDVQTFLEQVFPDKSVRKYFMDVTSDVFVGGNTEKIVQMWTGDGDNAKSVTQCLLEQMLGKLAVKLNTNVVTGKKPGAGGTFAELARAGGGVRMAVMEEPDNDEAINVGMLKSLSGNDSYFARDLFEKGKETKEIKPLFKLIFICNKLPRIKYADKAVWNRVRVIPFESTFCREDNPAPDTYEEQLNQKRFPMDKQFGKKIPGLLEPLAWLLLKHRQKITTRIEPEKVRAATEFYRKQNDIYRQFIDESIIEDKDKTITLSEVYNMFKDWFKDSLPGQSVPVKNEIEEYFTRIWGTPETGKKWKGYRMRTTKDLIKSGDAVVFPADETVNYDEERKEEEDEVINPLLRK